MAMKTAQNTAHALECLTKYGQVIYKGFEAWQQVDSQGNYGVYVMAPTGDRSAYSNYPRSKSARVIIRAMHTM